MKSARFSSAELGGVRVGIFDINLFKNQYLIQLRLGDINPKELFLKIPTLGAKIHCEQLVWRMNIEWTYCKFP